MTFRRLILVGVLAAFPLVAQAQEATFLGTITDATGGVLPGVTVTAVHEATGNSFEAVTDGTGVYRMPVRVGRYRVTAHLTGFTNVVREGVEVLVGRDATLNFQLSVSTVQETVTVTGAAPLVDLTRSSASGNVDPRQMSEIPVQGRDWQNLTMLAPGSRSNAVDQWMVQRSTRGNGQLNVDGQQVTNVVVQGGARGQPAYSKDAIAEFQYIANRFDATQGRSSEVQVNVITKSGTNTPSGTLSSYFRSDNWSAADPVVKTVLPYSNQQVSVTYGGPIRHDRVHLFVNYEFEREPNTYVYTTPFAGFNGTFSGVKVQHKPGARLDAQFSSRTRLTLRFNPYKLKNPYFNAGGATTTPSVNTSQDFYQNQVLGTLTQMLGTNTVNEIKSGFGRFGWLQVPYANDPKYLFHGAPTIMLTGLTLGTFLAQDIYQNNFQIRDDLSRSFTMLGRHDLKMGGEYIYSATEDTACDMCIPVIDARNGPIPANVESLFPNQYDPTTWKLDALGPLVRTYLIGVSSTGFYTKSPRSNYGAWIQDDWRINPRLTLNVGVRYDIGVGLFGEEVSAPPFLTGNRPPDSNNFAPRLGAAFSLNERTVLRGGFGRFYAEMTDQAARNVRRFPQSVQIMVANDGRPDFVSNPFKGPVPTYEQALALGIGSRSLPNQFGAQDLVVPYSYQGSVGVQRQIGEVIGIDADYVWIGGRREPNVRNINLSFDPVTGVNYPSTDARRPFPEFGVVSMFRHEGRSNYHGMQTAVTKRLSQNWQASATYLLSVLRDIDPSPVAPGCQSVYTARGVCSVPVQLPPDLLGEYTLAASDQRHRATFNGIWNPGFGFELSGLYFYGSGLRYATSYGGDLRKTGETGGRLRPNGSIVPRNGFVGKPVHRVDLRLQRRFGLGGRRTFDGIAEVYNAFNHANFGTYVTDEANRQYGQPTQNTNVAYSPRRAQLGFRFAF